MADLSTIRVALATQIASYIGEGNANVYPYSTDWMYPAVTVAPGDPYIAYFGSFGPTGNADIMFDVTIHIVGSPDDAEKAMDEFLSVGTGNPKSVVDALMSDRTLGAVVDTLYVSDASRPVSAGGPLESTLPVWIITRKAGAQV